MLTISDYPDIAQWLDGFNDPSVDDAVAAVDGWAHALGAAHARAAAIATQLGDLTGQLLTADPKRRRDLLAKRRDLLSEREAVQLDLAAAAAAYYDSVGALSRAILAAMRAEQARLNAALADTEIAYQQELTRLRQTPAEQRFDPAWPERFRPYYELAAARQPFRDRLDHSRAMWRDRWAHFVDEALGTSPRPRGLGGSYRRVQVRATDGGLTPEGARAAFITATATLPPVPEPLPQPEAVPQSA